jgi:hypothetical protein
MRDIKYKSIKKLETNSSLAVKEVMLWRVPFGRDLEK